MPFGKHRDQDLRDIPRDYLLWVLDHCKNLSPTLRREIERVLEIGDHDAQPGPPALTISMIDRWYRTLAMEFHPDRGGNHEAMKAINRAYDLLRETVKAR